MRRWRNSSTKTASTYASWAAMKRRCNNPEDRDFVRYGARGIKVCERWADDYDSFVEDMGLKPEGMTLERRDNSKGYSPDNCYWADREIQGNNRRNNRYFGRETIARQARKMGMSRQAMLYRANEGIPPDLPKRPDEAYHGTISRYTSRKHSCRCGACKEAWRIYNSKRRKQS